MIVHDRTRLTGCSCLIFDRKNRKIYMYEIIKIGDASRGYLIFLVNAEKPAAVDVGLSYDAERSLQEIKDALGGRELAYILLTHSHYDHVGALPQYREAFPGAVSVASRKTAEVLERPGALKVMEELSEAAYAEYLSEGEAGCHFDAGGFTIDRTAEDGDIIDLGNARLQVVATPGHTDCSISFLEPDRGDFMLSESTGVYYSYNFIEVPCLKSYKDCMDSIRRCDSFAARRLFIPHYGELKEISPREYFRLAGESADMSKNLIIEGGKTGMDDEELVQLMVDRIYRRKSKKRSLQPKEAFLANAYPIVRGIKREFPEHFKKDSRK